MADVYELKLFIGRSEVSRRAVGDARSLCDARGAIG